MPFWVAAILFCLSIAGIVCAALLLKARKRTRGIVIAVCAVCAVCAVLFAAYMGLTYLLVDAASRR